MTLAVLFCGFFAACPRRASGFAYLGPQAVRRCQTTSGETRSTPSRLPSLQRRIVALSASRLRSQGSSKYGHGGLVEFKFGLAAAQLLSASSLERARFAKDLAEKCV
jgi:hypothetical protein